VFSTVALLAAIPSAAAEVRGTWLTTTANEAISSPQRTQETMRRLRHIGLNTVFVEVWKNGYTEFPSQVMQKSIGVPYRIAPSPKGSVQRDLLSETLIQAHRNQLTYIAWFEYGFMAAYKDTQNELRARKDWLSLDKDGNEVAKNGFVWLNPLHPDAQNLLIGIVKEAIKKYDLDGIQLDDRIVWPYIDMGYDEFTQNLYAKEHAGQRPPQDPREPEWVAWRTQKVQAFAKRFVREVRQAAGKNFLISLSPGPHPWALENYLIDWPAWSRWTDSPTWDEYVPQVYRMDYASFARDWKQQVNFMGPRNSDLVAGIRLVGDGPDQRREDVVKHAALARETKSGGHCWWFSRGVLDLFAEELTQFYDVAKNGPAPHPKFPKGWRPAPIVAQPNRIQDQKRTIWRARVPRGNWHLIAKINGAWISQRSFRRPADGTVSVEIPGAEAVEILVDRRPEK
jgi:uncharacterized lipoprotein YddW (UPF0748 family)